MLIIFINPLAICAADCTLFGVEVAPPPCTCSAHMGELEKATAVANSSEGARMAN
jgi:hypothetical protein